jgi:hypothetical protein
LGGRFFLFFCLDAKEPKSQGCFKIAQFFCSATTDETRSPAAHSNNIRCLRLTAKIFDAILKRPFENPRDFSPTFSLFKPYLQIS